MQYDPKFYPCARLYENINPDNIPTYDCDNLMKNYTIIQQFTGGSGAMIYKVAAPGGTKVLKVIPGTKDSLIEVVVGCQLGQLVNADITDAYLVPEKWVKCNSFSDKLGKMDMMFKHLSKGSYYYMILPLANYTLVTVGNQVSEYDIVCMVFELLYGLAAARFFFEGFAHSDVKPANIFINKTNTSRIYSIKGKEFVLNSKFNGMLADFGQSYAEIVNNNLDLEYDLPNDGKGDLRRLIESFVEMYPKSNIIGELKDLMRVLIVNDKGYQDYTTIIDMLATHPLFTQLKQTKPIGNTKQFVSWEDATE